MTEVENVQPRDGAPKFAGVGRRAVAVIIDSIIAFFGLGFLVGWATGNSDSGGGSVSFNLTGGPAALFFALAFAYFVVLEATIGATPGKLLLGMRVRTVDGGRIGWKASLVRNVLRIVDGFAFYLVGAIVAWTSPRRQRLGDKLARTLVV